MTIWKSFLEFPFEFAASNSMHMSSSRLRVSSSSEEDVARGTGVQPYRFAPRKRSNSGDEESAAGELTLRYKYEN